MTLATPAYLKVLLKYIDKQPENFYSKDEIERALRNVSSEWGGGPYPIQYLWDELNRMGYDDEVATLQKVKPPRVRKKPVQKFESHLFLSAVEKATGKSVVDGYRWEGTVEEARLIKALSQAFAGLSKYPAAFKLFKSKVNKIHLSNPRRTEEGSWDGNGVLRIGIDPKDKNRQSVPFWRSVILHEMGHALEEDAHIDYFTGIYGHEPFISAYAEFRNSGEDFAETFREYNEAPRRLAKIAPEKFKDMRNQVLGKRVAARYFEAKRPVPLNWRIVDDLVNRVVKELQRQVAKLQRTRTGKLPLNRIDKLVLVEFNLTDMNREPVETGMLLLRSRNKPTMRNYVSGAAGKIGPYPGIVVEIDGTKTVDAWGFTANYDGFKEELKKLVSHEMTHLVEERVTRLNRPSTKEIPTALEPTDYKEYLNQPHEVRAHMQEVVLEAIPVAKKMAVVFSGQELLQYLLFKPVTMLSTWKEIRDDLTPPNRKKILKAVAYALQKEGLL